MILADALQFANDNPLAAMATVDGDQPRVRGMHLGFADARGFFFSSSNTKDLHSQLRRNPRLALYFFNEQSYTMLRVEGQVTFLTDRAEKEELFNRVEWIRQFNPSVDDPVWAPFKIASGRAYFWTPPTGREKPAYMAFGQG